MLNVKVYPDLYNPHNSQIYSGLFDLKKEGKINLYITSLFESNVKKSARNGVMWLQVSDSENRKACNVCFDTFDGYEISSVDRLKLCDIYFKRSLSEQTIKRSDLDSVNIAKIHPYGLNHEIRSINERQIIYRLMISQLASKNWFKNPINFMGHISREVIGHMFLRYDIKVPRFRHMTIDDFLVEPNEPAEPLILFQTRLWPYHEVPRISESRINELNNMRVMIVRVLKHAFGKRFIGGLVPTDYSRQYYPDLLSAQKTCRNDYMNLVKRCLICVTSTGLHDSIGFRLPEYLAASRCVISEPLVYRLPVSLTEGENYLQYRSPEECAEACEKILTNPQWAKQMRHENYKYYLNEVLPSALIYNRLKTALNYTSSRLSRCLIFPSRITF